MIDWLVVSVADVSRVITKGTTPTTLGARFQEHGINFVKVESLASGRIDHDRLAYIDGETHALLKRSVLEENDVLFSIAGTIGRTARVEAVDLPANTNQAIAIIRPNLEVVNRDFLFYCLNDKRRIATAQSRVVQSVQQNLSLSELGNVVIPLPPLDEQKVIAATLGALDDKIESNRRIRSLLRTIGVAKFEFAIERGGVSQLFLADACKSIARGIAPKYADSDSMAPLVLNQKCIRGGWISLRPARRMVDRQIALARKASSGDILVNSTGQGTLGRVGRWHQGSIFVDGHVSVVRPNNDVVPPTVLAYALFGREAEIEGLATGSTGQTELSPTMLGSLRITLPSHDVASELEEDLFSLESRSEQLEREILLLGQLRDVLLPELLSGRIQTSEALRALPGESS